MFSKSYVFGVFLDFFFTLYVFFLTKPNLCSSPILFRLICKLDGSFLFADAVRSKRFKTKSRWLRGKQRFGFRFKMFLTLSLTIVPRQGTGDPVCWAKAQ